MFRNICYRYSFQVETQKAYKRSDDGLHAFIRLIDVVDNESIYGFLKLCRLFLQFFELFEKELRRQSPQRS